MSEVRNIASSIRSIIGAIDYDTILCKVVSIDDDTTCTVTTVLSDVEMTGIRLNAGSVADKGIFVYPSIDSYVLVTMLDKLNGFVSLCGDVDRVSINIDSRVNIKVGEYDISVEEGILSVGNRDYSLRQAFDDLFSAIEKLTVTTGTGPSGTPINITEFKDIQKQLDKLLK